MNGASSGASSMIWSSRMCRRAAAWAGVILALLLAAPASAQVELGGALTLGRAEHRVDAGYGVASSVGTTMGITAQARAWRVVEARLHALGGQLRGDTVARGDRRMGEIGVRVALLPLPWLAIGGVGAIRGYDAQPATQRWVMAGAGAEVRMQFADGRMRSVVGGTLLPRVTVSGQPGPDLGVGTHAGMELGLGRLVGGVEYTLERYVYPTIPGEGQRHEQVAGLNVRVGARW